MTFHIQSNLTAYPNRFCKTLDGSKTGLTIIPDVLRDDRMKFHARGPRWKESSKVSESNMGYLRRKGSLKKVPFVMDTIIYAADSEKDRQLIAIEAKFGDMNGGTADEHLTRDWLEARENANDQRTRDLDRIEKHVAQVFCKHRDTIKKAWETVMKTQKTAEDGHTKSGFTALDIEVRQDLLRSLSKEFFSIRDAEELNFNKTQRNQLLASCAYWYDSEQTKSGTRWTRFPWDVAMRELCDIKARALGPYKTVTGYFYDHMFVKLARNN
jgi:RNA-dependent RNA polymerase